MAFLSHNCLKTKQGNARVLQLAIMGALLDKLKKDKTLEVDCWELYNWTICKLINVTGSEYCFFGKVVIKDKEIQIPLDIHPRVDC